MSNLATLRASFPATRTDEPVENWDGEGCAGCGVLTSRRWKFTPLGIFSIEAGECRTWFCTGQQQKSACRTAMKKLKRVIEWDGSELPDTSNFCLRGACIVAPFPDGKSHGMGVVVQPQWRVTPALAQMEMWVPPVDFMTGEPKRPRTRAEFHAHITDCIRHYHDELFLCILIHYAPKLVLPDRYCIYLALPADGGAALCSWFANDEPYSASWARHAIMCGHACDDDTVDILKTYRGPLGYLEVDGLKPDTNYLFTLALTDLPVAKFAKGGFIMVEDDDDPTPCDETGEPYGDRLRMVRGDFDEVDGLDFRTPPAGYALPPTMKGMLLEPGWTMCVTEAGTHFEDEERPGKQWQQPPASALFVPPADAIAAFHEAAAAMRVLETTTAVDAMQHVSPTLLFAPTAERDVGETAVTRPPTSPERTTEPTDRPSEQRRSTRKKTKKTPAKSPSPAKKKSPAKSARAVLQTLGGGQQDLI